jgi:hypothetical protein
MGIVEISFLSDGILLIENRTALRVHAASETYALVMATRAEDGVIRLHGPGHQHYVRPHSGLSTVTRVLSLTDLREPHCSNQHVR